MSAIAAITVRLSLTEHGDGLLYGTIPPYDPVPGMMLKHLLFAWHTPSFFGTELELQQVQDVEIVVLPSEQVIPFFAELPLLAHVEWSWGGEAGLLARLAPALAVCIRERRFVPSLAAWRAGKLQWEWDDEPLRRGIAALESSGEADEDFARRLQAAFSAAVFERHYGSEERAADLRREFPMLFDRSGGSADGLDEAGWLILIGWKADTAPFRPALQLVEPPPDDFDPAASWRLQLVLQDKDDPSALLPVRLAADGTVHGSWPSAWANAVRERAAGWLDRLRAVLPPALLTGDAGDLLGAPLEDAAAWQFLAADSVRLIEAGWQVLLPAWWEAARKRKPRLRAKVRENAGGGRSLFGLDAIIDFDWRIAVGNSDLTEQEFMELAARGERLVRFRGEWIALDPALLEKIRRAMAQADKSRGLTFRDVLELHLLGGRGGAERSDEADGQEEGTDDAEPALEVELNAHLVKLIGQLGSQSDWPRLPAPEGLRAELRAYQQTGFAWLAFLRRFGLGACLADDMGLGKTVQLIAYLLHTKETLEAAGRHLPALIICPTSVLGNWQKELSRFAPSLRVMLHYGSRRDAGEAFTEAVSQADVVLTSYATATLDQANIAGLQWAAVCLDEAQNIKNAYTKQSAAVRSIPALHRIALTGTPIENRLSELWSIYDFMNPGYFGSQRAFQERFGSAIEKERSEEKTAALQALVKPFMLRRKKKDPVVQLDLPDKNEMKTYVPLTAEQAALYEQTVNTLLEDMKRLEGIERKGAILAALTKLKQLCDHPALLLKEALPEEDTGFEAAPDAADDGNIGARFRGDDEPDRAVALLVARSAKLERLLEMVRELRDDGERCLIFTQYLGMGKLLQHVLRRELGEPVLYLHGGTTKKARDRMIDSFQSRELPPEEQPNVFILSLKAGGVGLNLTAANHVFHFDRWWNPAVENQATDRAYRIGQTRDVQVHKFISLGTLEERIDEMLESKQQLSDNVMSGSENWITELSTDALKELFTLRRDMVRT